MGEEAKVTSQDVWKILRETGKKIDDLRKSQKETDRQLKESRLGTDRQIQETDQQLKESSRQLKESKLETDRQLKESKLETDQQLKESSRQLKETDQQLKESKLETDRQLKETDRRMKETDRQMKENDLRLKELRELFTGQWGKLMETLVEGDLIKLLKEKEIAVEQTSQNLKGEWEGKKWEIDILAINGEEVVVVEVKTTLTLSYVKNFIQKILKNFTILNPLYKGKTIYGAVAYLKANQGSHTYAEKQGLFVIRATGSSASIINKKGFRPKRFP